MEVFIEQIIGTWLGKLGILAILFEVGDIYLKRADKKGVWEGIGDAIRGYGGFAGRELAEAIPGDRVEQMAVKVLERAKDFPDEFVIGLIYGLVEGISDPEKRKKIKKRLEEAGLEKDQ